MALADVQTLASDTAFAAKVKAAMVQIALSLGGDNTKNDERTAFAVQIIRDAATLAPAVTYAAAAQANGTVPATDAAMTTLVTTVLIAMARR